MAIPLITNLKLWVGTLFTKDDWDFNFRQIVSWLADGNADLVVNSVKATNGLDLDGATIKNVGAAQEGSEAVNLDQALTLLKLTVTAIQLTYKKIVILRLRFLQETQTLI